MWLNWIWDLDMKHLKSCYSISHTLSWRIISSKELIDCLLQQWFDFSISFRKYLSTMFSLTELFSVPMQWVWWLCLAFSCMELKYLPQFFMHGILSSIIMVLVICEGFKSWTTSLQPAVGHLVLSYLHSSRCFTIQFKHVDIARCCHWVITSFDIFGGIIRQ